MAAGLPLPHAPARAVAQPRADLLACGECDALYHRPLLASRDVARCKRCGATLERGHFLGAQGQLALTLAALVVFFIGSLSPIVQLELKGVHATATLFQAIQLTWEAGSPGVALLCAATAFVFPLAVILLRLWVLGPLLWQQRAWAVVPALRLLRWMLRWSMVEVFMLGVLVAVVRSAGISSVVLGPGLFAYAALTVLLTAIQASGLHAVWQLLGAAVPAVSPPASSAHRRIAA